MAKEYPFSAYDKYLCLKVSLPMWATIIFLVRPFAILLMSAVNRKDRTGLISTFYSDPIAMGIDMFAALPALLVIFAWIKRQPEATSMARLIWSYGKSLLLLATLLNVASIFLPFIWEPASRMHTLEFVKLAICAMILFMLLKSERVKDTFADFPQPSNNKIKPK